MEICPVISAIVCVTPLSESKRRRVQHANHHWIQLPGFPTVAVEVVVVVVVLVVVEVSVGVVVPAVVVNLGVVGAADDP